jgi:hypothetical protein
MTGQRGKPPGYPKSGGAKKGSVKTNTRAVKDAIREVFFDDLGGKKFLRKIAKDDPALFASLLAKLIPQEVRSEISINHTVDLGAAIEEANNRLAMSYQNSAPMVDITPKGDGDVCSVEATGGQASRHGEAAHEDSFSQTRLD